MKAVENLEQLLHDQPYNPLRPNQRDNYREELRRLEAIVQAPPFVGGDRGAAVMRHREVKKTLETQAPKPITGERANDVHRLATEVLDTVLKPAMLPRAVSRRNPPGAVDHVLKNELSPTYKRAAIAWKRAQWALDPETSDPNHTNLERFRPEGMAGDTSTFMTSAQIPGNFAMSAQAKEHWPLGEPTADTALKQVQRRERTPEQIQAAKDRMARARASRKPKGGDAA